MLVLHGFPLTSDSLSTIVRLPNLEEFFLIRTIFQGGEWNIGEEDTFENLKYLELEEVTLAKWELLIPDKTGGTFKSIDKLEKITNEVKLEQSPGATSPVMQTTSNPPASISTTVADSAEQLVDAHMMKEKEVQNSTDTQRRSHTLKYMDSELSTELITRLKTQILLPLYLPSGVVHVEQQVDAQQVELNLINSPISLRRLLLLFQLLSYPKVDAPALASRDISLGYVPKSSKRNRKGGGIYVTKNQPQISVWSCETVVFNDQDVDAAFGLMCNSGTFKSINE
ncbi:hypothetical protein CQW23_26631 [Capsicum baccatum]|uniref:Uncharacterized protein n=1 Tax=Capsicum baccatum TaxID=33114 RepID=A0A2G2VPE1_CAPBA|nr:hypothetical protein CQW23_26631 [Capsicum baccatum]